MAISEADLERALAHIEVGDCWLWNRPHPTHGYGQMTVAVGETRKNWRAHRLIWTALVGPIPDGMTIDHLCFVKACVNPDHLRIVTQGVNARSGHHRRFKVTCSKGHSLAGNIYNRPDGKRECRTCRNEAGRRSRGRRKQNG